MDGLAGYNRIKEEDSPLEDSSLDVMSMVTAGGAGLAASAIPLIRNKLGARAAQKELAALAANKAAKEAAEYTSNKAALNSAHVAAAKELGYKSVDDMRQAFMNHKAFDSFTDKAFSTLGSKATPETVGNEALNNYINSARKGSL